MVEKLTTINITESTWKGLNEMKTIGDTFEIVVKRLIEEHRKKEGLGDTGKKGFKV